MRKRLTKLTVGILVYSLLMGLYAKGQSKVTGVVTSAEDGEALPGVTITKVGTSEGTVTDFEGRFSFSADDGDILMISYVGFVTQRIDVGSQTFFEISLATDVETLEEVLVVGYGTVKKSDLTGSVAKVNAVELTAYPALSATQALQGRAAGLTVASSNGGEPGASLNVTVRGISSINANGSPLIVVDGFVDAEIPPPEDIASIEVLKDASAAAIYGSRATNGIVMITTKRGTAGATKIDFSSSYSVQQVSNKLDLLNGEEFAEYFQEFGEYEYQGYDTDWQDVIFQNGLLSNNKLSVSGGTENVQFYASGTYFEQEGVVIGSGLERFSVNTNVDIQASDRLKVGTSLYGRRSTVNGVKTQEGTAGGGNSGVIGAANRFTPDLGIYDENGDLARATLGGANLDNPYAIATEYQRERVTDRFQVNNYVDIKILEWLSFKSTLGIGMTNRREGEFFPTTLIFGESVDGIASIDARKNSNFLSENYFTFDKAWNDHRLTWVGGYSFQKKVSESWETTNTGFVTDSNSFWALDQGSNPGTPSSSISQTVLRSFYTRANYSLLDKYKFTFTSRYDGFSAFAENNKWGYFPAAAFAWNISEEGFLSDINQLTNLKLRTSYGYTGNPGLGAYQSLAQLRAWYSIQEGENAFIVDYLENAELGWETTVQLNTGLDLGLFNGRLTFSADYYDQRTRDLLFQAPVPGYVGNYRESQWQNIGELSNKGFELTIGTDNFVGDFSWSTNFIFSKNRNEIVKLADSDTIFYGESPGHFLLGENTQLLAVGQPVGVFFGYKYDGIYQNGDAIIPGSGFEDEAGGERFKDISGAEGVPDGMLDENDRTIIGDPNPDFTWSLNNDFSYKGFGLNVFITGVHGQDIVSYTLMELERFSGASNATTAALDRWRPENPNTDVPRAFAGRNYRMSDRFIYDASYIRFRNISLGYDFPKKVLEKIGLQQLKVYVSGQNLITITNYPGLDPEVAYQNAGSNSDANTNIGLDYGSYPNVKTYTFGLNLTL